MSGALNYAVFGLRVRSELMLPELFEADPSGSADVTIRRAPLRKAAAAFELERDGDALLLGIPDVATYRVAGGSEILVDAEPGVPERNVRLYLLGSAFGALLHQRGLLPLHANAVEIDGKAVAFMGESGAGKSTLAAWFHDRGYRVLADDVCVVAAGQMDGLVVRPGLRRLRLWKDALELSGRAAADYQMSFIDEETYEKYDVPVLATSGGDDSPQLGGVYLLERGDAFDIAQLHGVDAVECLMANTYRGGMLPAAGGSRVHWQSCVALARQIPIFRCRRTWGYAHFEEQMSALIEHVRSTGSTVQGC